MTIVGYAVTEMHGACLIAEEPDGHLKPVGTDEVAATNWHEVPGYIEASVPFGALDASGLAESDDNRVAIERSADALFDDLAAAGKIMSAQPVPLPRMIWTERGLFIVTGKSINVIPG